MIVPNEISTASAPTPCRHCGSPTPSTASPFCCPGCEFVHQSLRQFGLTAYYEVLKRSSSSARRAEVQPQQFDYCEDPRFKEAFVQRLPDGGSEILFFLDGIHCAACVWLLEKLPEIEPGIRAAQLKFASGELRVRFDETRTSPAKVAALINSLGYKPTAIRNRSGESARTSANRLFLMRIGVAAFCAMNIMMLSISLYQGEHSGIDSPYQNLFSWFSLALALPVVTFSALPFYRTALGGLRAGVLHIDLPIAAAIVFGFLLSAAHTAVGDSSVYYDSVAALVFLLLVGRWLQHRTIERAADAHTLLYAVSPRLARRSGREVFVESLQPGEIVEVRAGETIPVDGLTREGSGLMSSAILTGESRPQSISAGTPVFAGCRLVTGAVSIEVNAVGSATRIGKVMQSVEDASRSRPPLVTFLDRCSRGFTAVVLILALFTFLFWAQVSWGLALENAIALLIVTCPCVLAFATPLTFSLSIARAARRGLLFRRAEALEILPRARTIVLDKTGTLTKGAPQLCAVRIPAESGQMRELTPAVFAEHRPDLVAAALALEHGNEHPLAHALRTAFSSAQAELPNATAVEAVPGFGVRASLDGKLWSIGAIRGGKGLEEPYSVAELRANDSPCARFLFQDEIRPGARALITDFRAEGREVYLLSGDTPAAVEAVANQVGIPLQNCRASATPEEKAEFVAKLQTHAPTVMIGDGVNDAAAFCAAATGIGFQGGAESALRVADVYLAEAHLPLLSHAFRGSRRVMRIARWNLCFSVMYNILGGTAAMLGLLGPLGAAILMPLSSLTVVSFAILAKSFQE